MINERRVLPDHTPIIPGLILCCLSVEADLVSQLLLPNLPRHTEALPGHRRLARSHWRLAADTGGFTHDDHLLVTAGQHTPGRWEPDPDTQEPVPDEDAALSEVSDVEVIHEAAAVTRSRGNGASSTVLLIPPVITQSLSGQLRLDTGL